MSQLAWTLKWQASSLLLLLFLCSCKEPSTLSSRSIGGMPGGEALSESDFKSLAQSPAEGSLSLPFPLPSSRPELTPANAMQLINAPLGLFHFRAPVGDTVCLKKVLAQLTAKAIGSHRVLISTPATGLDLSACAAEEFSGANVREANLKLSLELTCSESLSAEQVASMKLATISDKILCPSLQQSRNEYAAIRLEAQKSYTLKLKDQNSAEELRYEVSSHFKPNSESERGCLLDKKAGQNVWTLKSCQHLEFQGLSPTGSSKQGSLAKMQIDSLEVPANIISGFYERGSAKFSLGDFTDGEIIFSTKETPPKWNLRKPNGTKASGTFGQ